ncbi:hypothetical protein F5X99DRAFT_49893 [Biscogniauxia marginata]|nr:hypothetical protein F5X99DRAFT_49893 [Biscogniauxia marginata]
MYNVYFAILLAAIIALLQEILVHRIEGVEKETGTIPLSRGADRFHLMISTPHLFQRSIYRSNPPSSKFALKQESRRNRRQAFIYSYTCMHISDLDRLTRMVLPLWSSEEILAMNQARLSGRHGSPT